MKRLAGYAAFAAVAAAAAIVASGCGSDDDPSTPTTDGVGLANPASVFCVEQGGTVEIVDEADGQVGYCNLPDGTRIEEWEHFRSENPTATTEP